MACAGRFDTKGLSITFVDDESDTKVLNSVQDRFVVNITELPDEIDVASYSKLCAVLSVHFGFMALLHGPPFVCLTIYTCAVQMMSLFLSLFSPHHSSLFLSLFFFSLPSPTHAHHLCSRRNMIKILSLTG